MCQLCIGILNKEGTNYVNDSENVFREKYPDQSI